MTQFYGQENRSNFVRPLVYYLPCVCSLQLFASNHSSRIISTWVGSFALRMSKVRCLGEMICTFVYESSSLLPSSSPPALLPKKHDMFLFHNFNLFKYLKCWKYQLMAFFFFNIGLQKVLKREKKYIWGSF